jgi:CheY-like chemotaxis protein
MSIPRILVIEDNPAEIVLLRHALNHLQEEYNLEVLCDGERALQFVEEHRTGRRSPEPCVILLDLYLPKYDGLAVLEAIKKAPALLHIQVMVLTGSTNPKDQRRVEDLGGFYREKPSSLALYVNLAAEILAVCRDGFAVSSAS